MPFFFMLSGFVFKSGYADHIITYINRRTHRLLVPYFLFNVLFAAITLLCMNIFGIWQDITPFSFSCLITQPLTTGHQFPLFNAGWFLVTLFFVQIVYVTIVRLTRSVSKNRVLLGTAAAALLAILVGKYFPIPPVLAQVGKIAFGLFFYTCGHYCREWDKFEKLFSAKYLSISIIIATTLTSLDIQTEFNVSTMSFPGNPLIVLLTSLNGSYITFFIAKSLSTTVRSPGIFLTLGEATIPIMCLHLLCFFILNLLLMPLYGVDQANLGNTLYKLDPGHLFPIYMLAGLFGPIALRRNVAAFGHISLDFFGNLLATKRSTP